MSLHLFAGLRVLDFQAARPWYSRLLGEPTFFPHATEAVWTLAEHRSVYVVEHADGAGHCVATIFVDDLDAHVPAIAARGLEPDEVLTYSNGVRKAVYREPDGNELGFGVAPPVVPPPAESWRSFRGIPDRPDVNVNREAGPGVVSSQNGGGQPVREREACAICE